MIRLPCLFICLAMTGCAGTGIRTAEVASQSDNPYNSASPMASELPGGSETEIDVLLRKENIGLEELLHIAEISNPELRSAKHDAGAAAGRLWQEELYPNPTLAFEAEDIPASDLGLSSSENKIAIVQPLVIGRRRSHAISAATAKQDKSHLLVQHKRRQILGEVRHRYVELIYLKQTLELHAELHEIVQQTFQIAKARFDAKAAPESEMIKTQIDLRELELGARRLQRQLAASSTQLQSLLGGLEVPVGNIRGQLPTHLPELEIGTLRTAVQEEHPAVLAARKEIEAAERLFDQTKAERIPDTELRLAYGRNAATDENIVEAAIGIPLPLFDRGQGNILESRHLAAKARRDKESVVHALLAELATTYSSYMTARDEVTTLQDQIAPDAEKAFTQAKAGYEAGKTALLDLLDAQRTLVKIRLSELESLRDMNMARAQLWKIAGAGINE